MEIERKISADVVAIAQEIRQRSDIRQDSKFSFRRKADENAGKVPKKSFLDKLLCRKVDVDDSHLKADLAMTDHSEPLADLLAQFDTNEETGLTAKMVERKHELEGYNRLSPPATTPEWLKLVKQMTGFFALLLWLGAFLCFLAFWLKKEADNLYLGLTLSLVVIITGLFSYFQERKSSNLMDSFKNMMPTRTVVTRDGKDESIDAGELCRGDLIKIKSGDKVPADIRVLQCTDDTQVDNSSLTGESEPQRRTAECTHPNPLETSNLMFFGTLVVKGNAKGVVVNIGDRSVMGRIAALATHVESDDTPIAKEIHHFILIVSAVAITLGVGFFIIGFLKGTDNLTNLVFMIGIIVANVPEGLLATVTVCLTLTAKRMATKSVLVKNMEGVETLGSTTCICSDKTGTLTQNIMTVANLVYDNTIYRTDLVGESEFDLMKEDDTFRSFLRCMILCNNATFDENSKFAKMKTADGTVVPNRKKPVPYDSIKSLGDGSKIKTVNWRAIGDGSESALVKLAQTRHDVMEVRKSNPKLVEIPFNSSNKYQLSIHSTDEGPVLVMKGAPERIISRCDTILLGGEVVPFTPEMKDEVEKMQMELQSQGRRVLGFSESVLDTSKYPADYVYNTDERNFPLGEAQMPGTPSEDDDEEDITVSIEPRQSERQLEKLTFIGLAALIDPPRPQVPAAVAKCKTAGIKVIMVTGDHPVTAKAIAKEVGIIWGQTREDVERDNAMCGATTRDHPQWQDPELAPAIVIPGKDFTVDTPKEVWDYYLDHTQIVFARTSPQQKLIIVENCQARGEVVAVTGDGVNDSPALKKADIGIAMNITGSDVSKEAADMILLDDNFASIVAGVEEGRLIFSNLKKSIAYTLSSNIPEISPFLCFITIQTPLPLSTVLILLVDLGTDMVPAISMAWENAEADIMRQPPRNSGVDRLVNKKLVVFAYLQIGVVQAAAGFFTWMVVLNDYGYTPSMLPGLGAYDNWGKQILFCKLDGGSFVNIAGAEYLGGGTWEDAFSAGYTFWEGGDAGEILDCTYPARNFYGSGSGSLTLDDPASFVGTTTEFVQTSVQSIKALYGAGYVPYTPFKAVTSPFWDNSWVAWNVKDGAVPGFGDAVDVVTFNYQLPGTYNITSYAVTDGAYDLLASDEAKDALKTCADCGGIGTDVYKTADFLQNTGVGFDKHTFTRTIAGEVLVDVSSRMCQKEALHHAQSAFFISIIVVQWADLCICKTRWLSIRQQGMRNSAMNFGLLFETILGATMCYVPFINGVGTRNIRLTHWMPGAPFSAFIFLYDELRKYFMRKYTPETIDKETGRVIQSFGWMARQTYY